MFVAGNPILYVDPDGKELHTKGDSTTVSGAISYMSGLSEKEFRTRYSSSNGRVGFNFGGLDVESNEGLKLLRDLITSEKRYLFQMEDVTDPAAGEEVLSEYGRMPGDDRPDKDLNRLAPGYNGVVSVGTNVTFVDEVRGLEVSKGNIAWHGLAECYARTDGRQKWAYPDRILSNVGNWTDYEGAHHTAMDRQFRRVAQGYGSGHIIYFPHAIRMTLR